MTFLCTRVRGSAGGHLHYRRQDLHRQQALVARSSRQCSYAAARRQPASDDDDGSISASMRSWAPRRGTFSLCHNECKGSSSFEFGFTSRRTAGSNAAFLDRWLGRGGSAEIATADTAFDNLRQQGPAFMDQQSTTSAPPAPLLSGAGGGIFFFHQLGALQYMQERYDMADETVAYVGASAGSLLVLLAACGVTAEETLLAADRLAQSHGVFERPLGVAGIWGAIIRAWLDELLPPDALERCRSRVHLVVTEVPSFRQQYLSDFSSRDDLLDAALASAHVPFLLDWSPIAAARGGWFVDGSLRDFILWNNSDLLTCGGAAFILDYSQDEELKTGRLDFMGLHDVEGARNLMALGYAHAARNAERIKQHFGDVAREQP